MQTYPTNIRPPRTIQDVIQKPMASSISLGGYAMTRAVGTRINRQWKLTYTNISEAEKLSLSTFFDLYANQTIEWVHPDSGTTYYVFFSSYDVKFKWVYIGRYSCEVTFTEDNTASQIPINSIKPTVSGYQFEGETITATTGSWSGSPTSYSYQWKRDGVAISGGTSSTYVIVTADLNTDITCTVVATNSFGDSAGATSDVLTMPSGVVQAKSVIIDIADNWASPLFTYIGVRSIDFYLDSNIIQNIANTDYSAYASFTHSIPVYKPDYAFDTSLSKTGSNTYNTWQAYPKQQRLICVFNNLVLFNSIVINNDHSSGSDTTSGIKTAKIYYSTDSITDTTYNATIPSSTLIFDGQIAEHVAADVVDDQTLTLINV